MPGYGSDPAGLALPANGGALWSDRAGGVDLRLSRACQRRARRGGIAAIDRIRVWLPVILAMSSNSPFYDGRDTGYASYRWQLWMRRPSAGPPRWRTSQRNGRSRSRKAKMPAPITNADVRPGCACRCVGAA